MKDIVIVGAGGWAREVYGIIHAINAHHLEWNLVGFLDENKNLHGTEVLGLTVLGNYKWLEQHPNVKVVVGIGSSVDRKHMVDLIKQHFTVEFPTLIHPTALVGPFVTLGAGTVMHAKSVATVNLTVKEHVILNVGTVVSHENLIADFVTIHPNSSIAGAVVFGEGVEMGTCCCVIQGVNLGCWSIVGAGSTVIKNVESFTLNVGVPTRVVKVLEQIAV